MPYHKIYDFTFGEIYPHYVAKVTKKGKSEEELIQLISWLTGYNKNDLVRINKDGTTMRGFFTDAKNLNPNRKLITGVICKIRVENIEDPLMQNIRYLDKIVDELARGKSMHKILRG